MTPRRVTPVLPMFLLLFTGAEASPFYLPSFHADSLAWNATDVVVVREGEKADGVVTVVETWAGDLERGDEITVEGLVTYGAERSRIIHGSDGSPTHRTVGTQRIVLFLRRGESGDHRLAGDETPQFGGIGIAAAWNDGGKAYVRSQLRMSGPQVLHESESEEALRERVLRVLSLRRALAKARAVEDESERLAALAALAALLQRDVRVGMEEVVEAIEESGEERAVETLGEGIGSPELPSVPSLHVANALVRIDPTRGRALVRDALLREVERWKGGAAVPGRAKDVHDRADKTQYLVEALGRTKDPIAHPAIESVLEVLETVPELKPDRSTIGSRCRRYLPDER